MRPQTFLAFDLGATTGRACVGRLREGRLTVEEIHRFPNEPVQYHGECHWDVAGLWLEMQTAMRSLSRYECGPVDGISVDAWGRDYVLLGERGILLENPRRGRNDRESPAMEEALEILGRERVYAATGIQDAPANTLFQLFEATRRTPNLLYTVERLITIPDLMNFWLSGVAACEYSVATTTQFLDLTTRLWSLDLLRPLGIPTHMLARIVPSGTVLGGLTPEACPGTHLAGTAVVATASHNSAAAMAAVGAPRSAVLSLDSSLRLGGELPTPVLTPAAHQSGFSNEGGIAGSTCLLKDVGERTLFARCRKRRSVSVAKMAGMAASQESLAGQIEVETPEVAAAFKNFCDQTGQAIPNSPDALATTLLENLAFECRTSLAQLEEITGREFSEIRAVGAGAQVDALSQFIADAVGMPVAVGPPDAVVLGNLAVQMMALGAVSSLDEAREVIGRSFPPRIFEPAGDLIWKGSGPKSSLRPSDS